MSQGPRDVYGMEPGRPEDYECMHLDVIRQRWDRKAERWDRDLDDAHFHLNEDDAYGRFLAVAETVIAERADFCRGHLLVDLGCGTGLVLEQCAERFAESLGVDLSPHMLEVASRRQLPRTRWLVGNCFELDRLVRGAGAVLSRGVLVSHYGESWAGAFLRQIHQALVPDGGFALVDFLNADARGLYPSSPRHKTYYRGEQMAALASEAGFRRQAIVGDPPRRALIMLAER